MYLPCQTNFNTIERPAIIFCNNRKECRRLALLLHDTLHDDEIYFYHAGLSKEEKTKKLNNGFLQAIMEYLYLLVLMVWE